MNRKLKVGWCRKHHSTNYKIKPRKKTIFFRMLIINQLLKLYTRDLVITLKWFIKVNLNTSAYIPFITTHFPVTFFANFYLTTSFVRQSLLIRNEKVSLNKHVKFTQLIKSSLLQIKCFTPKLQNCKLLCVCTDNHS